MKPFYTKNHSWVLLPTILSLLVLLYICFSNFPDFFAIVLGLFCMGCGITAIAMLHIPKSFRNIFFAICFCWSLYSGFTMGMTFFQIFWIVSLVITYFVFSFLLYQPTEKGQRLTEHLEGLKMFLKATKIPVKEKLSEKKMEKIFPYAMALGLEKEWEKKFSNIFGATAYKDFVSHHPHMSHSFCSSFCSNLSSCSTSRSGGGSGSGSGGGGCSGGGGGGGGGGGR